MEIKNDVILRIDYEINLPLLLMMEKGSRVFKNLGSKWYFWRTIFYGQGT